MLKRMEGPSKARFAPNPTVNLPDCSGLLMLDVTFRLLTEWVAATIFDHFLPGVVDLPVMDMCSPEIKRMNRNHRHQPRAFLQFGSFNCIP